MTAERLNKIRLVIISVASGVGFTGLIWLGDKTVDTINFVSTTKANNATLPQHIDHDNNKFEAMANEHHAFENSILLQLKEVTYQLRRRNDLDSLYHILNKHER